MEASKEGFVNFGEVVARGQLQQQCQYASRYVNGKIEGYPPLGHGFRFEGDPDDYHSLMINQDDVGEFVRRVLTHREKKFLPEGANWSADEFGVSF